MEKTVSRLDLLIDRYVENKSVLDEYKKIVDKENADIKSIMMDGELKEYSTDHYKASCTVSVRETMKEDVLLDIAHSYGISEIVKTKEYIDFDALENAIYNNRIPQDVLLEMDKAKETKEIITLRVTKRKEKSKE